MKCSSLFCKCWRLWILAQVALVSGLGGQAETPGSGSPQSAILKSEFIFEQAPFKTSHASTIVETREGLMAAWFGGSREGSPDVSIWIARHDGKAWSEPFEIANGSDDENRVRYPCWNPVLFQTKKGPLLLFYKVGPSPETWWGMLMTSENGGRTWTPPKRLPNGNWGPVRNKPVELEEGGLLCGSSTENAGWRVHIERTRSYGQQWTRTGPLNSALEYGAIQPTILVYPSTRIQILCRTKQQHIAESWSDDGGHTWSRMMAIDLPNPNSAIDAVMLRDGRALLVYNHANESRDILNLAVSTDGKRWFAGQVLENEPGAELSYPAVIQTSDGLVHVTYSWKRERIRHVVLDPFKLSPREMFDGLWR